MDTFVDSSWYFFRYTSPRKRTCPSPAAAADYWLPVDLYIGGVEHAILHLIYSRFFTKVLRDLGLTALSEPFPHYLAQGMVTKDGSAMSKSKGNVVDPDEMIQALRRRRPAAVHPLRSPPEKEFAWNEDGIEGCYRFLARVWTIVDENLDLFEAGRKRLHGRRRRGPRPQEDAPDDPQGRRGHRGPLPPEHRHQLHHGVL